MEVEAVAPSVNRRVRDANVIVFDDSDDDYSGEVGPNQINRNLAAQPSVENDENTDVQINVRVRGVLEKYTIKMVNSLMFSS